MFVYGVEPAVLPAGERPELASWRVPGVGGEHWRYLTQQRTETLRSEKRGCQMYHSRGHRAMEGHPLQIKNLDRRSTSLTVTVVKW